MFKFVFIEHYLSILVGFNKKCAEIVEDVCLWRISGGYLESVWLCEGLVLKSSCMKKIDVFYYKSSIEIHIITDKEVFMAASDFVCHTCKKVIKKKMMRSVKNRYKCPEHGFICADCTKGIFSTKCSECKSALLEFKWEVDKWVQI